MAFCTCPVHSGGIFIQLHLFICMYLAFKYLYSILLFIYLPDLLFVSLQQPLSVGLMALRMSYNTLVLIMDDFLFSLSQTSLFFKPKSINTAVGSPACQKVQASQSPKANLCIWNTTTVEPKCCKCQNLFVCAAATKNVPPYRIVDCK